MSLCSSTPLAGK